MNIDNKNWPYKWFGLWKEFGEDYKNFPSIKEFANKADYHFNLIVKIKKYLTECQPMGSTSRMSFPDPISGEIYDGSVSFRTDGEWVWLDDLADYIEKYNLILPESFLVRMEIMCFNPVTHWEGDIESLDYPNL